MEESKIQILKKKFQKIVEDIDKIEDEEELQRLSQIAEMSSKVVNINSPSTNYPNTDSDSSSKAKDFHHKYEPKIPVLSLNFEKELYQHSQNLQISPKQNPSEDFLGSFDAEEIANNSYNQLKLANEYQTFQTNISKESVNTCKNIEDYSNLYSSPRISEQDVSFTPKYVFHYTKKPNNFVNQSMDFTVNGIERDSAETIKKNYHNERKRRDREARSKKRYESKNKRKSLLLKT